MNDNETTRVLNAVEKITERFVVIPTREERDLVCAWVLGSWVFGSFDAFSRLYFRSVEPGSGKSKAMQHVLRLTRQSEEIVQPTASVIYRVFDAFDPKPVIGVDEADMTFGKKGSDSKNTDVLMIMNKGYENGGYVLRSRGQNTVARFNVYGPMVLAGMGVLPPALMTRCVTVNMRKPVEGETFTPYRKKVHLALYDNVRNALDKWSSRYGKKIGLGFPDLPAEIANRDAELFEPLIEIADLAGGEWGERIRKAAVFMVERGSSTEEPIPSTMFVKALTKHFANGDVVPQSVVAEEMGTTSNAVGKLGRSLGVDPLPKKVNGKTVRVFTREVYDSVFGI